MTTSRPRLLAYSHDGYGLGHLRRNLRIATGLRRRHPDLEALLATGAKGADRLTAPFGVDCVRLPSVVKVANGHYVADQSATSVDQVLRRRSAILEDAVRTFKPDLLLVDRHPRGLHEELAAALRIHQRQRPDAHAVLGLRDIIDTPEAVKAEWSSQQHTKVIRDTYQTVLCYGDPAVYNPVREYALPGDVAQRIRFTGYLTDELWPTDAAGVRRRHHADGRRLAVCTLGGGKDAAKLASSFLSAMLHLHRQGWVGVLITGPYMADPDVARLGRHPAADEVTIIRMAPDVPSYLAAADAVLCMAGYNTICEVLALAVPAVVVPRIHPRQEQRMRAELLANRGLLQWLHPDTLSDRIVADALVDASTTSRRELSARIQKVAHAGVQTTARILGELLPRARAAISEDSRNRSLAEVVNAEI